ncbi:MAG TPA: cytochrome c [Terriglobales bacterium]|nr:cytochrome c [Terriglobales bacterium]
MRNPTLVLLLLFAAVLAVTQATKPAPKTAYHPVPVADARQPNPVKPTPESLESGKKIYSYECASCHGATGDGKTAVAQDLKLPDLSDPAALKDRTDGEVFYVIKTGRGDMPAEGNRVKTEQLWDLVNYTRSLAKPKTTEAKPAN